MDDLRTLHDDQVSRRSEALECGYRDKDLYAAMRVGEILRIRPGAYTFVDVWQTADESGRHRLRAHAALRSHAAPVALSHTSAAVEHGLRLYEPDLSKIHLTCVDGPLGGTTPDIVYHHGVCRDEELRPVAGGLVVPPVRAALEAASLSSVAAGLVILDSLVDLKKGSLDEMRDGFGRMSGHPRARRLQVTVRLAREGAQSVGESLSRYGMWRGHLPEPELQFEVRDEWGRLLGISDFAWPDHGALGEFDGMIKYGRLRREGETPGEAVEREKKREDRLREETGWVMVRLVWAEIFRPGPMADKIRRQLARGRRLAFG
ncbi:MAG TPA: hypothetical protein VHO29_00340 [Marmoricola sp.]|nr:hypothetical protein [Marmoricola sp.]